MKLITVSTSIEVYDSIDELPAEVINLMNVAVEAREKAYAPYSKFHVGAAILLDNNEIIPGSNQENASYPSGLCAERTAIYFAGAKYPEAIIKRIAISATSQNHAVTAPIPPCGACRQAIAEYEVKQNKPIEIYFMGESGAVAKSNSLKDLLPFAFDKSNL